MELGTQSDFLQISLVLGAATLFGFAAKLLHQPLIIALLLAGVLVGPAAFSIVEIDASFEFLAQLGISLLLFLVGLRLDIQLIRHMGPVAVATGLGQVFFTSFFGFLIAIGFGMDVVSSLYVAIALTFSSTIIIVKLLSDKKEIDSLHGQIAVGFLIVQDLVVVIMMIILSSMAYAGDSEGGALGWLILRGFGFLASLYFVARYILPRLLPLMSGSRELLVLFSISWAAVLAATAQSIGLSKEVGAFVAGISLASLPFRDAMGSRLVSIRDFLLIFFFVSLGAQLDFATLGARVLEASVFSIFVLVGNPLIVIVIMAYMGYRARTGFLAGLTVAQISEFSLIFAALGLSLGHIDREILGLITLVGVITIGASTYMITYSHFLYAQLSGFLKMFERRDPKKSREAEADSPRRGSGPQVLVFGLGRLGLRIAEGFQRASISVLGIDFDPQAIKSARAKKVKSLYGDAEDPEFLSELPLGAVEWVICCVSDLEAERILIDGLQELQFEGKLAVVSLKDSSEVHMKKSRVDWWLKPTELAAERVVEKVSQDLPQ